MDDFIHKQGYVYIVKTTSYDDHRDQSGYVKILTCHSSEKDAVSHYDEELNRLIRNREHPDLPVDMKDSPAHKAVVWLPWRKDGEPSYQRVLLEIEEKRYDTVRPEQLLLQRPASTTHQSSHKSSLSRNGKDDSQSDHPEQSMLFPSRRLVDEHQPSLQPNDPWECSKTDEFSSEFGRSHLADKCFLLPLAQLLLHRKKIPRDKLLQKTSNNTRERRYFCEKSFSLSPWNCGHKSLKLSDGSQRATSCRKRAREDGSAHTGEVQLTRRRYRHLLPTKSR